MSKILFLGHEGSGKTVLMGILSRYFETAGDGKWCLNPKNESAFSFMENIPAILAAGQWPAQTTLDSIRLFEWDLEYAGTVYTKIEMVDYPGEAFRALFDQSNLNDILNGHRPDCTILSDLIRTAENIFLIINPRDILQKDESPNRTKTIWQLCEAVDYLKTLPKKPTLTLVLTQIDRYCNDNNTLNAKQLLLNANSLFTKRGFASLDVIAISAIGKTKKNGYGDDIPDMRNSHPINLYELVSRILVGTPVESDLRNLQKIIKEIKAECCRNCLTPEQCTKTILKLERLSANLTPVLTKYGYLLGDQHYSEYKTLIEQANNTIILLRKRASKLRLEEERERKQKEADTIIKNVKITIEKTSQLLYLCPILQTFQQCQDYIDEIYACKRDLTPYLTHKAILGTTLYKRCETLLRQSDDVIEDVAKTKRQLLIHEEQTRKQKEEEQIQQALNRLKEAVQFLNKKKYISFYSLCQWIQSIRKDCTFITQHLPQNTIAHDLIKINNSLCQYMADPLNACSSLLQFESKYPFIKNALLAIKNEKKRQEQLEQQAKKEAIKRKVTSSLMTGFVSTLFITFVLTLIGIFCGCFKSRFWLFFIIVMDFGTFIAISLQAYFCDNR